MWGKRVSGATKKLEKPSSFVKVKTSMCFLDTVHIEPRMSSRARCPIFSLYHLKSIRWKTFIVMLHHKADPFLLRYNILKYKLSLSISLMLLVSKTLVFVKSTLRSQISTHEASLP